MRYRSILLLFIPFLLLAGCSSGDEKKIRGSVADFLGGYKKDFRVASRFSLSSDLGALIDRAVAAEKADREKVRQSAYPTDKPHLIEGDVFTSLYEGYDKYEIARVIQNGNEARVPVTFTNTPYKISWQDTVVLKNENGWKIDDVLFNGKDKPRTYSGTRDLLQSFLKVAAP